MLELPNSQGRRWSREFLALILPPPLTSCVTLGLFLLVYLTFHFLV